MYYSYAFVHRHTKRAERMGRGGAWWGVEGVDGTWESRRTRWRLLRGMHTHPRGHPGRG
jgi:hypothetical protein